LRDMGTRRLLIGGVRQTLLKPMASTRSAKLSTHSDTKEMLYVAVVSPPDSGQLKYKPDLPHVKFMVANDIESFKKYDQVQKASAVIWIPPGDTKVLDQLWNHIDPTPKWLHSFFAGVDGLSEFTQKNLIGTSVPLTNGRGAFSSSLAEYAMTAILHFNKQIPRIQRNTKEAKWSSQKPKNTHMSQISTSLYVNAHTHTHTHT